MNVYNEKLNNLVGCLYHQEGMTRTEICKELKLPLCVVKIICNDIDKLMA